MTQLLGNAFTVALEPAEYQALDGSGAVGAGRHKITELGDTTVSVWEAQPGLIGGVTMDEVFVVIEGRAEVTFEDTEETITIGPGDVVRLDAGQRNSWRTFERIRKVSVFLPKSD